MEPGAAHVEEGGVVALAQVALDDFVQSLRKALWLRPTDLPNGNLVGSGAEEALLQRSAGDASEVGLHDLQHAIAIPGDDPHVVPLREGAELGAQADGGAEQVHGGAPPGEEQHVARVQPHAPLPVLSQTQHTRAGRDV